MFDITCLDKALAKFKMDFNGKHWNQEKYKWVAVKNFQDNWNVNAADFADMLTRSLSKTHNLLASYNNFPAKMIEIFANKAPEEVREMFISLYDENKNIIERIMTFKNQSTIMLKKYEGGKGQHYQYENAISVYLWLRYPNKYYIYKYGLVKTVAEELKCIKQFKKGEFEENLSNFYALYDDICDNIKRDTELINIFKSQLDSDCYPDSELKTLTVDFGYYINSCVPSKGKIEDGWFPTNYSPKISVDGWVELLKDDSVFTQSSLEIIKRMKEFGGQATCSQLALKYGETANFYNAGSTALARRIEEKVSCPILETEDDSKKWWPVLYLGKTSSEVDAGCFVWKLRDELSKAIDKVDLSNVQLYADLSPVIWKISHGTEKTGISETNKKIFEERHIVVVHDETPSKGQSKVTQAQDFIYSMKKGDYFYLCYGNSIQLLGEIVSDEAVENPEMKKGWMEKKYRVIAKSVDKNPYSNTMKWWTPNNNSTCIRIDNEDRDLFETLILKPYFNKTLAELLGGQEKRELYDKASFLNEVYMSESHYDMLVCVLKNKLNIILQGAPGVGKTFAAKRLAYSIMGEKDDSRIEFIQFHQNYSYEDLMMGYKPVGDGFQLKQGIFYNFCKKAEDQPDKDFFFIIDEINRGNMSKIFGELLLLIERDYRGATAKLAYNGLDFAVPKNLYIIGMMNTADRSLAMIDYALRRRFSFFEIEPGFDSDGFKKYQSSLNNEKFDDLIKMVKELNNVILSDKSLGKGFCIGHSYFCGQNDCTDEWLHAVVDYDIIPMLSEYWFDDNSKLEQWVNNLRGVLDD